MFVAKAVVVILLRAPDLQKKVKKCCQAMLGFKLASLPMDRCLLYHFQTITWISWQSIFGKRESDLSVQIPSRFLYRGVFDWFALTYLIDCSLHWTIGLKHWISFERLSWLLSRKVVWLVINNTTVGWIWNHLIRPILAAPIHPYIGLQGSSDNGTVVWLYASLKLNWK